MRNIIDIMEKVYKKTDFDFREYANPKDELSHLFEQWVDYYKMKYAICRAIKPKRILEIGVRYGYSAISFLKAAPYASYLGIDNDSATFGGSIGAFQWAKKITEKYKADFLLSDTQKLTSLPGEFYDLIHIDGQQDGDGTFHDLEMALEKGNFILVDGFFWSTENMLSSTYFMKKYSDFFEYAVIVPGYAGDLLIKTKDRARNIFSDKSKNYLYLKNWYNKNYYLTDCGGYENFAESNGMVIDDRLRAVYSIADPKQDESILDIGCGRGELAYVLSKSGCNVIGLDYSNDAIEIAKKTYGQCQLKNLEFICIDVLDYNTERKFDKIIASDVFEHIEQDMLAKVIEKVLELLKEDGSFIVHTYPNLLKYKYGHSKKRNQAKACGSYIPRNPRSYYEDLMHINEFTPARLRNVLRSSFKHTLTWVNQYPDIAGSLNKKYTKSDFMNADSIFSIATNSVLSKEKVLASIMQTEIDRNEISIRIETKFGSLQLLPSRLVNLNLIIHNNCKEKLASFEPYPVYLSYHWVNEKGEIIIHDGIRTALNIPILPGRYLDTFINIMTPDKPGKYYLQITMVQENCFWFEKYIEGLPLQLETLIKHTV